ncbi:MAG: hypothetical protein ACRDF4_08945 [Rhabdochlamydiaceae bacterium]
MTERMQKAWHKYDSREDHKPSTMRQAAKWAVADGLLELPEVDPIDILAEKMANAVRSETRTDAQGRRYRVNHAVRVTKSGIQYTFWGVMGFAPHEHMVKSLGWRRNLVIDDCFQLKTDVDVYNDQLENKLQQFQLKLDFTNDVAEREEFERMKNRRKDVA